MVEVVPESLRPKGKKVKKYFRLNIFLKACRLFSSVLQMVQQWWKNNGLCTVAMSRPEGCVSATENPRKCFSKTFCFHPNMYFASIRPLPALLHFLSPTSLIVSSRVRGSGLTDVYCGTQFFFFFFLLKEGQAMMKWRREIKKRRIKQVCEVVSVHLLLSSSLKCLFFHRPWLWRLVLPILI